MKIEEPSIKDELTVADAAWQRAIEAIKEAWRLTPEFLIHERTPIKRTWSDQTIALECARAMSHRCGLAQRAILVNVYARERGHDYALTDDREAAERNWKPC